MAKDSGVTAIVDHFLKMEKRDSSRNSSYDEVLQFYAGTTYKEARKQGFIAGIAQNIGSLFSPKSYDEDAELTTPINLVKPAIENKVAFLALPPTIRIIEPPDQLAPVAVPQGAPGRPGIAPDAAQTDPATGQPLPPPMTPQIAGIPASPGPTNADWGTNFADREERVLSALLAFSNMPQRCRDVAWSMCAMDGAVIGAWPDIRHGRPRLFTRTPQDFYPVSYDPDGLDLQSAVWNETMTGTDIIARYGEAIGKKYGDRDEVHVIQYIDETQFCTILDKTEFAHPPLENKMGVVPIVCVGSLGLPGMIFGSTDIKDAIPVAKMINSHVAMIEEMSSMMIRPTLAVKDPLNVPDDIALGKGGVITMGPNGSVDLLGPIQLPNAFWQLSSTLQNWFDLISDNPNILRSDDGGGLTTGKGFNAKLGPIAARMQQRLEILMAAYRQAFKYMLMMWADFPGMKSVKASGVKLKESYYIDAQPSDFIVNGQIWTEMDVFLSAQSFMDRQGNAVEIMQLYQNELMDWDTAVDNLAQITDKGKTRRRIDQDRQWKAEGMAIANQASASPTTANPNMADQQSTNYGLERGMTGETGPMAQPEASSAAPPEGATPPMPVGPETATAPQDTAAEIISVLDEFFASIGKLRGTVFWGGDPILEPDKVATDNFHIDVWVSDPQDQGTITRAAENVKIIYGHLKFHRGAPDPAEQAKQVGGSPEMSVGMPPEAGGAAMPPEAPSAQPGPEDMGIPPELLAKLQGGE
jgi:hypothetical protein